MGVTVVLDAMKDTGAAAIVRLSPNQKPLFAAVTVC